MSTGLILGIAIPASAILLMRFRKRWLAKFNIAVTNRITGLFAGWLPGFGIVAHMGRKSGKLYRRPTPNGFIIALTYSSKSEWVKNVLAAGSCELKTRGKKYQLFAPTVVRDPSRRRFPFLVRIMLGLVGADEYMEISSPLPLGIGRREVERSARKPRVPVKSKNRRTGCRRAYRRGVMIF